MVFSSTIFLFAFLPFNLMGYYLVNPRYRNVFLLMTSLLFYAWGEPKFVFVMLLSILMNYAFGLLIDKYRGAGNKARVILIFMTTFNITIFFVFKYLNFTLKNLSHLFGDRMPQTNVLLPIGISFFTFQAMSYVFDVYRRKGKVQKNPLYVGLYITFFPQLIAGPIVRYETISDQINNRVENVADFAEGVKRFVAGLAKKIILSNSVALLADQAFGVQEFAELTVGMSWMGALAYAFQIYFDFSGYSDMAIGLGKMFGFHFEENFNYPYISKSVSEFWRRWHISLGTWFRDYVYFPMGGSRVKKKSRLIFNLFVVWLLTGVWHGANWTFFLWGLLYFALLSFEKITRIPGRFQNPIPILGWRIFTLLGVLFGWVLFRAENIHAASQYIKCMFGANGNALWGAGESFALGQNYVVLLLCVLFSVPLVKTLREKFCVYVVANRLVAFMEPVVYTALFIVSMAFTVTSTYNPFIYFNF